MSDAWVNLPNPLDKTKPDFDHAVYKNKKSTITLMSVDWDTDYDHVIDWKTEEERDAWFDSQVDAVELETGWSLDAGNTLKLSEPHTVARNFNYVVVNMYADPVASKGTDRKLKYFYFVTGVNKINPSVSHISLKLDTWTTYSTSAEIAGLRLERGHYPHALNNASKYLANPLENNLGVTAVEPDLPTVKPLVSFEKFVSSSKGSPRVVVAMTADLQDLNSLWLNVSNFSSIGRPSSKALPADYWWEATSVTTDTTYLGSGGYAPTPAVATTSINASVPGALKHYSFTTSSYPAFINLCRKKFPQVLKAIQAIYVLDSSLLTENGTPFSFYTVAGIRALSSTQGQYLMDTIGFSKSQFNYDPKYDEFAKLYTNQFAVVEVSNLNGHKIEISIEDVSESLEVYNRVSHLFPFIKLEAFINGVGGKEKINYTVYPLASASTSLYKSQWEDFKFDLEIPTYAITAESREANGPEAQAELWDTMQKAFSDAGIADANTYLHERVTSDSLMTDLTNNQASINNTQSNQLSSILRRYNNDSESISKEFSNASELIAKDYNNNSELIAATKVITDVTVQKEYDNSIYSSQAVRDMTTLSLDLTKLVSENNTNTVNTNTIRSIQNTFDTDNYELIAQFGLYHTTREVSAFDSLLGIYNSFVAARLGIMASTTNSIGAIAGAATTLNVGSMLSAGIGGMAEIAKAEALAVVNGEVATLRAQLSTNTGDLHLSTEDTGWYDAAGSNLSYHGESLGQMAITYQQDVKNNAMDNIYGTDVQNIADTTINSLANIQSEFNTGGEIADAVQVLNNSVAGVNLALGLGNNETRNLTDVGVNDRTKSVSDVVANRNKTVDTGIATRNKGTDTVITNNNATTDNANLTRSYNTDTDNLADNIETKLGNTLSAKDARYKSGMKNYLEEVIEAPTMYLENKGGGWVDAFGNRGLDVRIRRCSKGIEKMAGDMFSRYGYYTDGLWIESPVLSQMTKFTFWKAEETWITASHIDETNKEILRNIFKRGTTVWVNPAELLRIDITTNKTRSI
jgi:hypothetical protein